MLWTLLVCIGMALLFPKGFKFLVGTVVGLMFGGFCWGLVALVWTPPTFGSAAQSFAWFLVTGAIAGNVFAAKG